MSCVTPINIKNEKYGNYVTVPCGKCYGCLKRKRSGWLLRLESEHRDSKSAHFLTLTYNDENLPFYNGELCFNKSHVQKYLKRLRKYSQLRYYCVSEYGGKFGRPHYHMLLFNYLGPSEKISDLWPYGFTHIGDVTSASINYCAAYVITKEQFKFDLGDPRRPFATMSKRPGIGNNYISRYSDFHQKNKASYGIRQFGEKVPLPRYYSEKIFDKITRQALGAVHKAEAFNKDLDPVINWKDFKEKNPSKSRSDYHQYRQQLIEKRSKKVVESLKQIRDVENF